MAVVVQEIKVCHHHCSCLKISMEHRVPLRANLQAFTSLFLFQNWDPSLTFSFVWFTRKYFYLLVPSWSQHGISISWAEKIHLSDQIRCCFPWYLKTPNTKKKTLVGRQGISAECYPVVKSNTIYADKFLILLKTRPHKVCSCSHLIYPIGSTDKFLFPLCVQFHLWKGCSEGISYSEMSPHSEPQLWKEWGPWSPWTLALWSSIYKQKFSSWAKNVLVFSLETD